MGMMRWPIVAGTMLGGATLMAEPSKHRVDLVTAESFQTSHKGLQRLYQAGSEKMAKNISELSKDFPILVEGGGYSNAWIETQPMGGEMFAKANLQVALNNQVIFMLTQRADGRFPGMVVPLSQVKVRGWDKKGLPPGFVPVPKWDLIADYEMFQGYCFPEPAWRMYFWIGKDKDYLGDLYQALKAHDAYLWRTRDSNGDGLLETWCMWDTGEDSCTRLHQRGARDEWPYEKAPGTDDPALPKLPEGARMPFQSMDIMSYSYSGREVLSRISKELGNGEEGQWAKAAEEVRRRMIDKLWNPTRHACFDLDRHGRPLDELIHNNLRCMWYGSFTQEMADAFIKHHLLNPDEFWGDVPLPSIAKNEALFFSHANNNWSGQPQGLTYQRAIGALEKYGHVAEISLIGQKLFPILIRNDCRFTQQLDPVTGDSLKDKDGYGPMILAMQEYVARMHGIHVDVELGQVWWSGLDLEGESFYASRQWGAHGFAMYAKDGKLIANVNGKNCFESALGCRVVTDLEGRLISVVGISPQAEVVKVTQGERSWEDGIKPNQVKRFDGERLILSREVPFDYPYRVVSK